ncbi:hypothetical protein HHI36_020565 [Cryptolaemus montrouzieri]|uniref:Uncharacterized protein n=1 Tax=Cryptolaemus montrouzieri TaxID=559131 RepID=A0ABD2NAV5_9CUCU
MRDPDPKHGPESMRPGRNFNVDLQLRYLSPGAFTVLPPEDVPPPDPPQAPVPYRLTPTTRRNRNQAFSIIAEPHSRTTSRSPSPTGRVSPFRGRGFNPTGSRHASPAPSPPPEIAGDKPPKSPNKKSKIPQIQRRNSSVLFGEKVSHSEEDSDSSPTKNGLNSNLSQSMTNISPSKVSNKPPPSPQKNYVKNPAFRQLSPIIGSSPEPSQSQSSPSRIPTRSRSQPQSRLASPSRPPDGNNGATNSKPPSRTASRNPSRSTSRVQSRNTSREPSPSNKTFISPSKSTKYQNVQPKVNSFIKPKVPTKPTMTSDSELSDKPTTKAPRYKKNVNRVRNSVNKVSASNINTKSNEIKNVKSNEPKRNNKTTTNKKNNIRSDNNNSSVLNSTNLTTATESDFTDVEKKSPFKNKSNVNKPKANVKNTASTGKVKAVDVNSNTTTSEATTDVEGRAGKLKNNDSSIKLLDLMNQASAASIVPSTADTVTKPLKIDANIELSETDLPKGISPMVDGRVLSATSVSHAINKMNDTVLDTKTLMRESGLSKLSPAANAIISMSRENNNNQGTPKITSESSEEATKDSPVSVNHVSKSTPTKNEPDHTEQVNSVPRNSSEATSNHVASVGLMDAKTLEMHVQNSLHKLTAAENSVVNSVQKSVNEKIRETRAVFAPDVKPVQPIQIVVKEKPNDQDVESGNVRLPVSSTNGSLHGRPR